MHFPNPLAGLLLALAGCTVYAPMQPSTPLLTQRGQAEIGASLQPLGRLEITGAYSPVQRMVLAGGLTGAPRLSQAVYLVTAQYEAGVGYYQPLSRRLLLSSLVGFGQAYSRCSYQESSAGQTKYEGTYRKYYGQFGVAYVSAWLSPSLTYRLTDVRFSYLNDSRVGALPLSAMLRHELAFAVRKNLGASTQWQMIYTAGLSVPGTTEQDIGPGYQAYGTPAYHAGRNLQPAVFASVGIVFCPGRTLPY